MKFDAFLVLPDSQSPHFACKLSITRYFTHVVNRNQQIFFIPWLLYVNTSLAISVHCNFARYVRQKIRVEVISQILASSTLIAECNSKRIIKTKSSSRLLS